MIPLQDLTGLKHVFEMALPTLLLYHFERPQYTDLYHKKKKPALISQYGAIHLVRLFGKSAGPVNSFSSSHLATFPARLPELIIASQMSAEQASIVVR